MEDKWNCKSSNVSPLRPHPYKNNKKLNNKFIQFLDLTLQLRLFSSVNIDVSMLWSFILDLQNLIRTTELN